MRYGVLCFLLEKNLCIGQLFQLFLAKVLNHWISEYIGELANKLINVILNSVGILNVPKLIFYGLNKICILVGYL